MLLGFRDVSLRKKHVHQFLSIRFLSQSPCCQNFEVFSYIVSDLFPDCRNSSTRRTTTQHFCSTCFSRGLNSTTQRRYKSQPLVAPVSACLAENCSLSCFTMVGNWRKHTNKSNTSKKHTTILKPQGLPVGNNCIHYNVGSENLRSPCRLSGTTFIYELIIFEYPLGFPR